MNLENAKLGVLVDRFKNPDERLKQIQEKISGIDINSDLSSVELDKILNEDEIKYVMSLYDEINKFIIL